MHARAPLFLSDRLKRFRRMSPDTQKGMVKLVHQYAESARVAIRGVRHKALADIKKAGISSKDEVKRLEKAMDELTKSKITTVDYAASQKERELGQ